MNWQKIAEVLVLALSTIDHIIDDARARRDSAGLDAASDALTAIGTIVDAVKSGRISEVDLDKAAADLDHLRHAVGATDTRIDELIRRRFGTPVEK